MNFHIIICTMFLRPPPKTTAKIQLKLAEVPPVTNCTGQKRQTGSSTRPQVIADQIRRNTRYLNL
jgi:hypothetical protein